MAIRFASEPMMVEPENLCKYLLHIKVRDGYIDSDIAQRGMDKPVA